MLIALLEPSRPPASIPSAFQTNHPPFKFGVAYSGFRGPYEAYYNPAIATPILHFLGSLDTIVDEARSMALVEACVDGARRVVFHPGGHYLPAGRQYVNVLLGFVRESVGLETAKVDKSGMEGLDLPF